MQKIFNKKSLLILSVLLLSVLTFNFLTKNKDGITERSDKFTVGSSEENLGATFEKKGSENSLGETTEVSVGKIENSERSLDKERTIASVDGDENDLNDVAERFVANAEEPKSNLDELKGESFAGVGEEVIDHASVEVPTEEIFESNKNIKQYEKTNSKLGKANNFELTMPQLITSEAFYCEHNRKKVPVRLQWLPVKGATSYEVVIHRSYKNRNTLLKVSSNKKDIMVYPNARYVWKVMALNDGKAITAFSEEKNLYVKAPVGEATVSTYEENFLNYNGDYKKVNHEHEFSYVSSQPIKDQLDREKEDYSGRTSEEGHACGNIAEDYSSRVSEEVQASRGVEEDQANRSVASVQRNNYTLWSKFWFNFGAGLNLTSYEQAITDTGTLDYEAVKSPNFRGELGLFLTKKVGIVASGFQSPGNLTDDGVGVNEDYSWDSYSLEGVYLLGEGQVDKMIKSNWYLRFGLSQHQLPLLEAFPSSNDVSILENKIINLGLGIGNRTKFSKDFRADFLLRYQHPVSSETNRNTYSLDSAMLIDLYISANYQLHKNMHMGLFLNSQYFELSYDLADDFESVSGTQSLLNNILGMYLGFEL